MAGPRRTPISGKLKKQLLISKRQQKRCESAPDELPDVGPDQQEAPVSHESSPLPKESYIATVRAVKRERRGRAACHREAARSPSPEEQGDVGAGTGAGDGDVDGDGDADEDEDDGEEFEVSGHSGRGGIFSVLAHEDDEGEESESGQEHEHQACIGRATEEVAGSDCEQPDDEQEELDDHLIECKSQEEPSADEDAPCDSK